MNRDWLEAIAAGAAVITVNRRLSRRMRHDFDLAQQALGIPVWRTPPILSWEAWVAESYREAARMASEVLPVPLNEWQEQMLWESIIAAGPDDLLQVEATAKQAREAWSLARRYRIPLDSPAFQSGEDTAIFQQWGREFRGRLEAAGWVDADSLPDLLAGLLRKGAATAPEVVILAGFEEWPPQQECVLEALRACGADVRAGAASEETDTSAAVRVELADPVQELRSAACWARAMLERTPGARIGVVVPDLQARRKMVDRIFLEVLHPELAASAGPGRRAYHLSLGPNLSEYPEVRAALNLLESAGGVMELASWSALLRSPFLAGATAEMAARARLDQRLRGENQLRLSTRQVLGCVRQAGDCPRLAALLEQWIAHSEPAAAPRLPSFWASAFTRWLAEAGWPGERSAASETYQTLARWSGLLSELATLDAVMGAIPRSQALQTLRRAARRTPFQPEDEGAPVQVFGLLESAGETFDFLWVSGLREDSFPPAPRPNPFLPLSLQRQYQVRHSSARLERELAQRLLDRLRRTAPEVIFSYPRAEQDRNLRPSSLLDGIPEQPWSELAIPEFPSWAEWLHRDAARQQITLEQITDETGPAFTGQEARGGTKVLQLQSACPFRAFAELRLHATPPEAPSMGPDARLRGTLLHLAMENLWQAIGSRDALLGCEAERLRFIVHQAVACAIDAKWSGDLTEFDARLRELERRRLETLLADWLELEKQRETGFVVEKREQEHWIEIGGLRLQARIDRVDRLEDGSLAIIDYKSTAPRPSAWEAPRPEEPQLPLYCVSESLPVKALAFAQLKTGDLRFFGLAEQAGVLPGVMPSQTEPGLAVKRVQWQAELARLAGEFRAGHAAVDPKKPAQTCRHCHLPALCRIHEIAAVALDNGEAEEETGDE